MKPGFPNEAFFRAYQHFKEGRPEGGVEESIISRCMRSTGCPGIEVDWDALERIMKEEHYGTAE